MKKLLLGFFAILGTLLTLNSCNEDIDLVGDFEETAVVYGLLDQSETVHMIKITRAFIGPGDALAFAQIPDSNYFNSVEGTITEYYNSGAVGRIFTLKDTLVDNKDENGVFYAPQQKLYYFTTDVASPLIDNAEYQLDLVINGGEFEVSGRTELAEGMTNNNISGNSQPYRFMGSNGDYLTTNVIVANAPDGTVRSMNTKLTVEFTEWVGGTGTTKSFDWSLGEAKIEQGDSYSFQATGATFYNLLAGNCTNDPTIERRTLNSITATIVGATEDLVNYIEINAPSSTIAQSKPTFTNLTATNGNRVVGVFAGRNTLTIYKPFIDPGGNSNVRCLNKLSTQHMCTGAITAPYFFCSDHPADISSNESWACP